MDVAIAPLFSSLADARQNIRDHLRLWLRALRAAVMEANADRASFHVAATDDEPCADVRRRVTQCSALAIFALNGVALKSESTRTMLTRSSFTMGLA
jgi:hypothetical protein